MATNVNNETGLIGITPKYKFHDQVTIDTGDTIQDVTWLDCEYLAKFKKNSLGPMIVRPDYIYEDTSGSLARNGVTIVGVTTENTLARVTDPEVLRILLANISHTLDNQIRLSEVASGSIGASWFAGNTKIEVFDCPRGYSVAASAFNGCTGLREVFIQRNVSLGNSAFNGCNRVDCYHFLDTNVGSFGTTVFAGLSGSCYLYVPNEAVVNYCKVANLGSYITRIRGHIKGWHLICADGSYKYNLRDCYDTATNISFRLEGTYVTNLALAVDPETNEATVTVTGMLPDTDENAQLYYEFDYRNHHFSGYVPLHLKTDAAEIIEFEDPEVKRICVANWGGIYRMTLDGYEGELTKEQAAAVTSMGTQFKGNKVVTVFHELKYFSTLNTLSAEAFKDTTSLRYITLPNSLRTIGNNAFLNSGLYELEFNEGLTTLNNNQIIWGCASLARVTYPSTITSITGINASTHSNNLTAVISFAKTPPSFSSTNYIVGYTYFYVPNESLKAYRLKASWSSYDGRVLGFFSGPSNLFTDGTYTYSLRSIFDGYTDLQFSLEPNDYVTLSVIDGSAVLECSGITQDTESEAHLSYSFVYKERTVSGTIDIPIAYKEVIEFEDAEVKRICVANWGGEYRASSNLYGIPGEITYEQAAAVTTIGAYDTSSTTVFTNNKLITKFTELRYFVNLQTCGRHFVNGCSNLTEIVIPPSVIRFGNGAFQSTQKLTKFYCYPKAAPAYNDNGAIFSAATATAMGYNTRNTGNNEFHVPVDATGYELGQYGSSGSRLLSTSYCGFHIVYDL